MLLPSFEVPGSVETSRPPAERLGLRAEPGNRRSKSGAELVEGSDSRLDLTWGAPDEHEEGCR